MATSLKKLENEVQIIHLHVERFHVVKRRSQISPVNSEVTGPNFTKF